MQHAVNTPQDRGRDVADGRHWGSRNNSCQSPGNPVYHACMDAHSAEKQPHLVAGALFAHAWIGEGAFRPVISFAELCGGLQEMCTDLSSVIMTRAESASKQSMLTPASLGAVRVQLHCDANGYPVHACGRGLLRKLHEHQQENGLQININGFVASLLEIRDSISRETNAAALVRSAFQWLWELASGAESGRLHGRYGREPSRP